MTGGPYDRALPEELLGDLPQCPGGQVELGTRCEVKNINSLRSLGRAIEYEARRQVDIVTSGERVEQQTRHWNEDEGRTHKLRSKEEAFDYRYFPEPDLMPVEPSEEWIAEIRSALPLLPRERRHRLAAVAGVDTGATALTVERGLDDLAVATIGAGADAGRVLVHLENNLADGVGLLTAGSFAALVAMETGGGLTATQAKTVLAALVGDLLLLPACLLVLRPFGPEARSASGSALHQPSNTASPIPGPSPFGPHSSSSINPPERTKPSETKSGLLLAMNSRPPASTRSATFSLIPAILDKAPRVSSMPAKSAVKKLALKSAGVVIEEVISHQWSNSPRPFSSIAQNKDTDRSS